MTFWTHQSYELFGDTPTDAFRSDVHTHVPNGATLLRTIVDVAISDVRLYTPSTGQQPFMALYWYVADLNSDFGPHPTSSTSADDLIGIPVLAHGCIPIQCAMMTYVTDYNADTLTPVAPIHGSITGQPDINIDMRVWGHDHADSHGQRQFLSGHPETCASVYLFDAPFGWDKVRPMTFFSIRHLWNVGSL